MAHPNTEATTHEGTIESAVDALSNFDFDTNEMIEQDAPEEVSEEPAIEEVEEEEVEEDLTSEEPVEAADEAEVQAIDAPVSWSAEQKEVFASLPPDAQQVVVERESERDRGFNAKATELADERKRLSGLEQQINIERQQYAQSLSDKIGENVIEPSLDLLRTNPDQYLQDKTQFDQMVAMQMNAKQQADYYAQQTQQQEVTDRNAFYASRNKELSEKLPEFIGDAQYRDGVLAYGRELGYSDDDLTMARTADLITIDKARKYDALISKKVTVGDKLKTIPKVVKPGAMNTESKATRSTKANLKRHKSNGNVHSAAKAMEGMFD